MVSAFIRIKKKKKMHHLYLIFSFRMNFNFGAFMIKAVILIN